MIENISISEKGNKVLELGDIIRANTTVNHREGVEESQDGGYFVKVISLQILELKGTLNGIYKKNLSANLFFFWKLYKQRMFKEAGGKWHELS